MDERFDWSASLGRWLGMPVRVHVTLLLVILCIFAFDWNGKIDVNYSGTAIATTLILILCLLVHELAHAIAIYHLGGEVHSFVLAPWGGASSYTEPGNLRDRMVVNLYGPFVNGIMFLFGLFILFQANYFRLGELINPLQPQKFNPETWAISLLAIFTWTNFQIFLINLLPCFPFDGGRFLRNLFFSINRQLSVLKIESTVLAVGQLSGIVVIVIAILFLQSYSGPIQPVWAWVMGFGIVMIFCARYDYRQQVVDHIDTDEWDDETDDSAVSRELMFTDSELQFMAEESYSQWLLEKQNQRELLRFEQQLEVEMAEEAKADMILSKLYDLGITSLTDDERLLLERVSARVRRRRQLDA